MALHGHSFFNKLYFISFNINMPLLLTIWNIILWAINFTISDTMSGGGGKTLLPQSNRLLTEHLSPIDFTRIAFSSRPSSIQTKSLSFHWNTVMRWMKKQVSINVHQFFLFNIYKIDICNVHIRKLTLVFITRISNQVQQLHHCRYQLGASG